MKLPNPLIWAGLKGPPKNEFTKFSKKLKKKKKAQIVKPTTLTRQIDYPKFRIRSKYSVEYRSQTQSPNPIGLSSVDSQNGGLTYYIFPFKLKIL